MRPCPALPALPTGWVACPPCPPPPLSPETGLFMASTHPEGVNPALTAALTPPGGAGVMGFVGRPLLRGPRFALSLRTAPHRTGGLDVSWKGNGSVSRVILLLRGQGPALEEEGTWRQSPFTCETSPRAGRAGAGVSPIAG